MTLGIYEYSYEFKLNIETSMKSLNNIKLNYSLSPLIDMRTIIYDYNNKTW